MRQNRGTPAKKPATGHRRRLRDWESARVFLEVARTGSFRAAAQTLHEAVNTVRRRIDALEHEAGATLFTRHVDGVRLTEEGTALLEAAGRMEKASFDIARFRDRGPNLEGEIRIGITEGLGAFWLVPHLARFGRPHPNLLIEMKCEMSPVDVLRLESDIAVQITRPTSNDVHMLKLGRLHSMPFASKRYLERHGVLKSLSDLGAHRIALQVSPQLDSIIHLSKLFPGKSQVGFVSFRTNVSSAHYFAISSGAGIGILPTYTGVITDKLEALDVDNIRFTNDIWLSYHPDAVKLPRIRAAVDWLVEAFSPKKYPWFGNEFIHPRDLPREVGGLPLFSLFEGFEGVR